MRVMDIDLDTHIDCEGVAVWDQWRGSGTPLSAQRADRSIAMSMVIDGLVEIACRAAAALSLSGFFMVGIDCSRSVYFDAKFANRTVQTLRQEFVSVQ